MNPARDEWNLRIDALWKVAPALSPQELVRSVDALCAERPSQEAAVLFERACARDSAGLEAEAASLYRAALAGTGLDAYRSARARLQLASTLRLLGQLEESERLLLAERDRGRAVAGMGAGVSAGDGAGADTGAGGTPLYDEACALLALTWLAQGKAAAAAALAIETLAPHLSRYQRSMATNARHLGQQAASGTLPLAPT